MGVCLFGEILLDEQFDDTVYVDRLIGVRVGVIRLGGGSWMSSPITLRALIILVVLGSEFVCLRKVVD